MTQLASRPRAAAPAGGAGALRPSPPGPPLTAVPRLLRALITDRLGLMAEGTRYGDAARLRMGPRTVHLFNSPEAAKHVLADNADNYVKGIGLVQARRAIGDGLLTSDGELWRTQRALIRPAFQHKRIVARADVVAGEATALAGRLGELVGRGPVDVGERMTELTLGVLGHALLDADLASAAGGGVARIGRAFEAVQAQAMFEMVTLSAVPTWLPLAGQLRFRRARRDLERIVARLVHERGRRPPGEDVLSRLVASAGRETDPAVGRRRVRDELVTLLLAGHETTASTLTWTLHLVDQHPDVARRLHEEAVAVLGDRPPRYEDLQALTYTAQVVQEVMRLYPPVWILPRQAVADDEVAGFHVPAGADVVVCPYTMHRHPGLWDDPARFDPERFAPDRTEDRPRYAYIPFGGGPRYCVGSQLGTMEAVFVVATLARSLRLRGIPGRAAVPEPMLSLRVRGGLQMTVHPV
ncbi:cytochrome P450 [Geodermatophilus maliterrae]|uniref:Cytochrome P450 n=1 Tax=Geodermatophilus maliterrae TaxID=3162531 RepID=A0ABV3XA30_9ACTN